MAHYRKPLHVKFLFLGWGVKLKLGDTFCEAPPICARIANESQLSRRPDGAGLSIASRCLLMDRLV